MYVAAFVTAYARLKLYSALELLDDNVLYFDTDSVMYCSPTDSHILPVDNSGTLGAWADEVKKSQVNFFTEFVSAEPKTYPLKSSSGKNDKGRCCTKLSAETIWNRSMNLIHGESKEPKKQKLLKHTEETMMKRNKFQLQEMENPGKIMNMTYDKRQILTPTVPLKYVTVTDTLPFGHCDVL